MTPADINFLSPLIAFLVVAFIVSIPVVAFSARYAIKPVVDALIRLREVQGSGKETGETLVMHDRRLSLMETELQHISSSLERLADANDFERQLTAGSSPRDHG